MPKPAKILLIAILSLLGLASAAAAVLAATFNPNDYKPQLIRLVQQNWQRTIAIPGSIRLTFFPRLGVDLGQVSISEHQDNAEFASVENAQVSLQLLPLLSRELVAHQVRISGLTAHLRRHADGSTNYDDLLPKERAKPAEQPAQPHADEKRPFRFNIDGIDISNARLLMDDEQNQRQLEIAVGKLATGKVASGVPSQLALDATVKGNKPALDVALSLKTGFTIAPAQQHYAVRDFDARLKGMVAGQAVEISLQAPELEGDLERMAFASQRLLLALSGKKDGAAIEGKLDTPLSADLKAGQVELARITAAFVLPNPGGGTLKLNTTGRAGLDLAKDSVSAALNGTLDESSFDARLGMTKLSSPAYTFDIGIDRLDADHYRAKPTAAAATTTATPPTAAPQTKAPAPVERPTDLSALIGLQASGKLRIGSLKAGNIRASDVRLQLRAADGKLQVDPLMASLYGGSASGSLSATAGKIPAFTLRQNLTGIHVGPLLTDALGKSRIEGRGNVSLDVTAAGANLSQIKNALDGTARLALRDGALRGISLAQTIRSAKARIGALRGNEAPQQGQGSTAEKTDFSELSASFRIADGVAHNEDLDVKSPLLRLGGAGNINLADASLDYTVKASIVSTLKGQGGAELEQLKGLTIPVRLQGPFDAMNWSLDFKGMASELARQKIEEKKAEVKQKADKALEQQKGRLEERLKGLFGK
jgi:AsmA protein